MILTYDAEVKREATGTVLASQISTYPYFVMR